MKLSKEQLISRLNKKVKKLFSKKEQEVIQWTDDKEDKVSYSWNYQFKGAHYFLAINKRTGSITHGSYGVSK
ncbi:hypothetical protein CN527_30810 [Bacillus cereus]|nr:hypothetical protein CN527_30810 [Bacillus cereus]